MDRKTVILAGITRDMLGVEIGPWHAPLVPKRDGYRSLSLDIFDAETLRGVARKDPHVTEAETARIEEVDLIGAAGDLAALVEARGLTGQIDYIISSHNFEHIPDPVRFLQGCARVLRPGGILSLVIPDRRGCFDYFRPHSTSSDVIIAYVEQRSKPTPAQWFRQVMLHSRQRIGGEEVGSWDWAADPSGIYGIADIEQAYSELRQTVDASDQPYLDTHCWALTPASFEQIVRDLQFLGLIAMRLEPVSASNANEFYSRFINQPDGTREDRDAFYRRRNVLLHRIVAEYGAGLPGNPVWHARVLSLEAKVEAMQEEIAGLGSWTGRRIIAPLRALSKLVRRG